MKAGSSTFLIYSSMLLITISVFSASCILTAAGTPARISEDGSSSLAAVIMDAGRTTLSAWLYEKADLYFHMGKPKSRDIAFGNSLFQRITSQLGPETHVHRSGEEVSEIVPWLWMASRADPKNVHNYLTAAFWLAHEAGRSDIARQLLAEARWNNPFSYPIAMEDGIIALRHGDISGAESLLDAGLRFWDTAADRESEDARHDRARMLLYRALLYEAAGDKAAATEHLREILLLFPERHEIERRISELESGTSPSLLASSIWSDIVKGDIDERREHEGCQYDDHAHGDEDLRQSRPESHEGHDH